MKKTICLLLVILGTCVFPPEQPHAKERVLIDLGKAQAKRSLLALPPFKFYGRTSSKAHIAIGQSLFNVTLNDLTVTGFFKFVDQDAFLEDTSKVGLRPAPGDRKGFDFKKWKAIGSDFLIRGGYKIMGSKLSFEAYVYYVPQARLVFGRTYEGPSQAVRKIAHTFANDIVKSLTGRAAMFNSKIVTSRSNGAGVKEIFVMDWDGANSKRVTSHRSIAISPTWSPKGDKIAYTAFAMHTKTKSRNADLFVYDIKKQKRWLVSYKKGINSGASFFPSGKDLLLTISRSGNPDIYRMKSDGSNRRRLTKGPHRAMNVEPSVSPNGKNVVFSSDRSGRPMIFTMKANGSGVKRLTHAGKYNSSPVWSPDGRKVAFAGMDKGRFDIFIMNSDGTGLKRLTTARKKNGKFADNESPSFSPDGRHITFTSNRTGINQLYLVGLDGKNERRITFDGHAYFQPKWSPFLD